MVRTIYSWAWFVFLTAGAWGQVQITAQLNRDVIGLNESARLEVTVNVTQQGLEIPEPSIPDVPGLQIISAGLGAQQSSYQFLNGQFSFMGQQSYYYDVLPIGGVKTYDITGIKVGVNGQDYVAPPLKLRVYDNTGGAQPTAPGGTAPAPSNLPPQTQNQPQPSSGTRQVIIDPNRMQSGVQFDLHIERDTYFVGEAIRVIPSILRPSNLGLAIDAYPQGSAVFPGCLVEEVPKSEQQRNVSPAIGGRDYVLNELNNWILYPLSPGDMNIQPVQIQVLIGGRSFFNPMQQRITLTSLPVALKILDLPQEGRPEGFRGAVGKLQLEVGVDRSQIEVGEATTLTITLSGEGNITHLPEPLIPDLPSFEKYETTSESNVQVKEHGIVGWIRYETLLVARKEGTVTIPTLKYSYFDPSQKKYILLESSPIDIAVAPASGFRGERIAFPGSKREIELSGVDFRHIAVGPKTAQSERLYLYREPGYILVLILPFGVLLVAWFWSRRRERIAVDIAYARGLKAPKEARKLLSEAKKLADRDATEACSKLAVALTDYIDRKWSIPARGMTSAELESQLNHVGVSRELAVEVRLLLDDLAHLRYASVDGAASKMKDSVTRSETILAALMRVKS